MKTPEERWEEGIPHHEASIRVMKFITELECKTWNDLGYSFGGDGDNGEDMLYVLDAFFEEDGYD